MSLLSLKEMDMVVTLFSSVATPEIKSVSPPFTCWLLLGEDIESEGGVSSTSFSQEKNTNDKVAKNMNSRFFISTVKLVVFLEINKKSKCCDNTCFL